MFAAISTAPPALAQTESADAYPSRAVRIVVPFPPGGTADTFARVVAEKMQAAFGQPFMIENKPGATGLIATSFVANAAPDGYTLVFGSNSSQVVATLLQATPSFHPLNDFSPISILYNYPLLLVINKDVPANSVRELVALAKAQPGKLNMGSIGTGSGGHLTIAMFKNRAGFDATHIPYRGIPAAQLGLMTGETHMLIDSIAGSKALIDDGRLRGLAVTGRERSPVMPQLPTLKEEGLEGFEDLVIWQGLLAPAKTPPAIIKKLEAEMRRIAGLPDVQKRIQDLSARVVGSTSAEMSDVIAREAPIWTRIIKDNNITTTN